MTRNTLVPEIAAVAEFFDSIPADLRAAWALRETTCYEIVVEVASLLPRGSEASKQVWRREFVEYVGDALGVI